MSYFLSFMSGLFGPFTQDDKGDVCVALVNKERSWILRQHSSAGTVSRAGNPVAQLWYTWCDGSIGLYWNFEFWVIPKYS